MRRRGRRETRQGERSRLQGSRPRVVACKRVRERESSRAADLGTSGEGGQRRRSREGACIEVACSASSATPSVGTGPESSGRAGTVGAEGNVAREEDIGVRPQHALGVEATRAQLVAQRVAAWTCNTAQHRAQQTPSVLCGYRPWCRCHTAIFATEQAGCGRLCGRGARGHARYSWGAGVSHITSTVKSRPRTLLVGCPSYRCRCKSHHIHSQVKAAHATRGMSILQMPVSVRMRHRMGGMAFAKERRVLTTRTL
jgi:hypothetical protein